MTTSRSNGATVSATATASGGGFASLLTIAFIVLKLTGVITWSWWWVLAPLWGSFLLFVLFLAVVGLVAFLYLTHKGRKERLARERAAALRTARYAGRSGRIVK